MQHPMRSITLATLAATLGLGLAACGTDVTPDATAPSAAAQGAAQGAGAASSAGEAPGTHRQYGAPQQVGNGRVRTYVVLDRHGAPLEVGVAFDEGAMDGLPAPMGGGHEGHGDMHEYLLAMPAQNTTPFRFVELDWNPAGHEPAGIYDKPHFDFHFYTVDLATRNAIDPADPQYGAKAANFPAPAEILPGFIPPTLLAPGAPIEALAVPRMGMHWLDPQSPELPPTFAPFTATMIQGTWNGQVIFLEPMITREYIMSKPNATRAVPLAENPVVAGYYPDGYRVSYDAQAKEYRVALTGMTWQN